MGEFVIPAVVDETEIAAVCTPAASASQSAVAVKLDAELPEPGEVVSHACVGVAVHWSSVVPNRGTDPGARAGGLKRHHTRTL